ncbi:hypothetical protein B4135_0137 [Caldibacillus debilis]|uniref:Uncharacterized protein n=1 Tax=Caldibacillus debilis TaxID=301148 RepID=A0A150M4F3_9BACI|nr:hypothetical protein B4135_0137 [Caldibacillus debilis]
MDEKWAHGSRSARLTAVCSLRPIFPASIPSGKRKVRLFRFRHHAGRCGQ